MKATLKEKRDLENCAIDAQIVLIFRNGEQYHGIYRGMDGDDIMLRSNDSKHLIGLPMAELSNWGLMAKETGAELIAAERERQVDEEWWTTEHDEHHVCGELARAGAYYALSPFDRGRIEWPFDEEWFKPTPNDRVRELVKAGALIAAEIDRLQNEQ